jgi:tetratricopeptide (TPR) repeat protein
MRRQARRVHSKTLKKKTIRHEKRSKAKPKAASHRAKPVFKQVEEDPRVKQAREQYEVAVAHLNAQKYEKAMAGFEKVLSCPSPELAERARVHINMCRLRIERRPVTLKTADDHYNFAVAKINTGHLEEAEEHLTKALKQMPKAGHIHYALAAVQAKRSDIEAALESLKTAIGYDGGNRYLARSDEDFAVMFEDPRFADLVYPEKGAEG